MMYYIGTDFHKESTYAVALNEASILLEPTRIPTRREESNDLILNLEGTVGNWYWMITEMERAEHPPILVHAAKAKLMIGQINKTDKLDAKVLAVMLRNGTLPSVWIPSAELRDQRELPRMRMSLVRMRTTLKNRIHLE
jgi:transposase